MDGVGSGILTGDSSSVLEVKRQRHDKRQEKVNNCCCGIFTALWKSRHQFCVGIGVVSVVLACVGRDLVIGILALKCLLSGCWGLSSRLQAEKAKKEYEEVIEPQLQPLMSKLDQWPKRHEDLTFEQANEIYPELLREIEAINAFFQGCKSSLLKKEAIKVPEVYIRNAQGNLDNIKPGERGRNHETKWFMVYVYMIYRETFFQVKALTDSLPRRFDTKKDQDLF